jgi:hypothetical protein
MIFADINHKQKYLEILGKMTTPDVYHCAVAYLLALDGNICNNPSRIADCFDFREDCICRTALDKSWIAGFDRRVLKLAFNLWNDNNAADVSDVLGYGDDNLDYLLEAIRIRFGATDMPY